MSCVSTMSTSNGSKHMVFRTSPSLLRTPLTVMPACTPFWVW